MFEEAKDGVVEMTEIGFCHVHDLGDPSGKVHSRVHSVTADQTSTRRVDQFFKTGCAKRWRVPKMCLSTNMGDTLHVLFNVNILFFLFQMKGIYTFCNLTLKKVFVDG